MTTFHSRQTDCAQRARKNEYANTFNFMSTIAPSIYTARHTKRVKTNATIFKSRCSRTVLCYRFDRVEALPLSRAKVLRLANGSPELVRSPARWSRDVREPSGKKSSEMSRVMSEQFPGNGRSVAATMPPDGRRDESQDNLRYADVGRTASAPETCKTTRNLFTQWRCNHRATVHATSCMQLVRFSPSAFNRHIQKL